jgi:hypothetical protein
MMFFEIVIHWTLLVIIKILATVLGLIMVPLGLMAPVYDLKTKRPFTQYHTKKNWYWVGLCKRGFDPSSFDSWIFWLFSNDRDGAMGDKRGWWFDREGDSFMSQFKWMALRNPANNLRFVRGISVNMFETEVVKVAGQDEVSDHGEGITGWHLLMCQGKIFKYYGFYFLSSEYGEKITKLIPWLKGRVLIIRLGHKMRLNYNHQFPVGTKQSEVSPDEWQRASKGFTFRFNPFLKLKD